MQSDVEQQHRVLDSILTWTLADVTMDYRRGWADAIEAVRDAMVRGYPILALYPLEQLRDMEPR